MPLMIGPKLRHAALLHACPELFDPARRVLEVGGAAGSIVRSLDRPLVAVGAGVAAGARDSRLTPVVASVTALPFVAGAFDDVICADVLHRIRRDDRPRALAEWVRVAAGRVIVCVPAGAFAASSDAAYAQHLMRTGHPLPDALRESQEHGIPAFADLVDMLAATGRRFTLRCNESVTAHYAARFVDEHPFLGRYLAAHDRKFPAEAPLDFAEGDLPYSFLAIIETAVARGAHAVPSPAPAIAAGTPRRVAMYAAGHRLDRMPAIPGIEWIYAGAGGRDLGPGAPALRDDTGDHISGRNHSHSELTALYWLWRNTTGVDAVGFCQYRRYFDFRPGPQAAQRETYLHSPEEVERHRAHFADRAVIARHLAEGAIVVARPMPLAVWNPEQYMIGHVAQHYLAMLDYVLDAHPDYTPQVLAQARDRRLHGCNMFVMPWRDFDALCAFWFDCLFGIEKMLAVTRTGYHGRVFAFLAERVFDLHVRRLADAGRRVADYPLFCLDDGAFRSPG